MSEAGVLAGKRIAVTRPAAQAGELVRLIGAAGGLPQPLPLLEIAPLADVAALTRAVQELPSAALAIFISPNAVLHAVPTLIADREWPAAVQVAALGPGTVRALAAFGIDEVLLPVARFDSEALLALPALQSSALAGRRVLIFRGDGGRELLADSLAARGAQVEAVPCYRRSPPPGGFADWSALLLADRLDALAVSSSEGLRYLCAALAPPALEKLRALPAFVPHARIAETAMRHGMRRVVVSEPSDAGIFAALCAYNWSRS